MTTREPPNLRKAVCCSSCRHYMSWECYECLKHEARTSPWKICDDYEAEKLVERDKNKVCKTCNHRCYCNMTDVMKCRKFGMAVSAEHWCDDYEEEGEGGKHK